MKPRIVIVAYRPLKGKESGLMAVVKKHLAVLSAEGLVTDRKPIVMRAGDGSIVEVFEWKSGQAITAAHTNAAVQALWSEFSEVCSYEKPVNIAEFQNLFSEFEPVTI
jgi:hypothetical protein